MLKKWIVFSAGVLLFFSLSAFSNLPEYRGIKPVPSQGDNSETEAQLQDPLLCEKGCERQVNVQRDRDPHGISPQEAHAMVKKVLRKTPTTTLPTDDDGSR